MKRHILRIISKESGGLVGAELPCLQPVESILIRHDLLTLDGGIFAERVPEELEKAGKPAYSIFFIVFSETLRISFAIFFCGMPSALYFL